MTSFSIRSSVPVLIHLLGWALFGFILLMFQPLTWQVDLPPQFWVRQGCLFVLWMGIYYLNTGFAVPKLLLSERTGLFIIFCLSMIALVLLSVKTLDSWLNLQELMERVFFPKGRQYPKKGQQWFDMFRFLTTAFILGISTSITAVQKWQHDAELRQALEQDKTRSELSFLKAQINPHFFFNTLNNIYALTLIDIENAREALHRLSRMMRYVLYETQSTTTLLSKEIDFIQDYIQLMQLRLTDKVKITLEVPEPLNDVAIAPMLLLPFVENAFKHGVSATQPSHIVIIIKQIGPKINVEVRNTLFSEKTPSLELSNGIGLVNTRRRLDLLYPERYALSVNEHTPNDEYAVHLSLNVG